MTTEKRRAVASNVVLNIGTSLVNLQVDLLSARPSDKTGFSSLCPSCEDPHAVSERYICSEQAGHGPFTRSQLKKGREIDKVLYSVTDKDEELVKETTITKDEPVRVRIFDAAAVAASTRPTGVSYLLRPLGKTLASYAAFAEFVADPKMAFLAEVMVRGSQKLYRLESWNGQLVLQELIRPNELAVAEPVVEKVSKDAKAMLKQIIEMETETFKADEFRWITPERVEALDNRLISSGAGKTTKGKKATGDGDALLTALQASLAAGKAKSPKKKTGKITELKKAS